MGRKRFAGYVVLGLWVSVGAIVIACGSDDETPAAKPDAGGPQPTTTTTTTTTATSTGTTPPPDTGAPDTGSPTDAGVDARAIWAFNAYCGDAIDASCPDAAVDCPVIDGGLAGQDCSPALGRCVNHVSDAAVDRGIADRVFVCSSVATPSWAPNRLCDYESCDKIDAAACPSFGGDGVAGQACTTPRDRCLGNERVFLCAPNGGLFQDFNGYCDAGMGTRACNDEVDACAPVDGGVGGSACTVERQRCYAGSEGNKIFVCAKR